MEALSPAQYIRGLSCKERRALALRLGISMGHLNNVAYGQRETSPLHAARLEAVTEGKVPRYLARPEDWQEIWPELAERLRGQPAANDEPGATRQVA